MDKIFSYCLNGQKLKIVIFSTNPSLYYLSRVVPIMFREAVVMSVHPADRHPLWSQVDLLQSPEKFKNGSKWIKMDQNGSKWIELYCIFQ